MARHRTAGVSIYIQEELSDARLRADELKSYVVRALDLVQASPQRDHFYAVAGDIIHAVPECMLKLERALQAAAMATNELDTNELKQVLRPEKIDELERVLEDLRVRIPRRTGTIKPKVPNKYPNTIGPDNPDFEEICRGKMEIIRRQESLEATNDKDAVEMYAFDLGYQKVPLEQWLVDYGKILGVDVQSEYDLGKSSDYEVGK